MRFKNKTKKIILPIFFGILLGVFLVGPVILAASMDAGLEYGASSGLGSQDIRTSIMKVVRAALGFLGVLAIVIVLYGGFIWMTAGGNEEKITQAKKILTNGVIGLIIILTSFMIVSFIISQLLGATGVIGESCDEDHSGDIKGCDECVYIDDSWQWQFNPAIEGCTPECHVKSIQPNGVNRPMNTVIQVRFNYENITGENDIRVFNLDTEPVSEIFVTKEIDGKSVRLKPFAYCSAPWEEYRCFEEETNYQIVVNEGSIQCGGYDLACGGLAGPCIGQFKTGDFIDVEAPTVIISENQVCRNTNNKLTALVDDDYGIAGVQFEDNHSPALNIYDDHITVPPPEFASVIWDTYDYEIDEEINVTATARDYDDHIMTDNQDFTIRAEHCCNGIRDGGETAVDCGGPDCEPCLPTIEWFWHPDGAPGNMVTIRGRHFGAEQGEVFFSNEAGEPTILAGLPVEFNSKCTDNWTDTEVIVVVPEYAKTGPIKIVDSWEQEDRSDDERGSDLPDFEVNGTIRPGLCAVLPLTCESEGNDNGLRCDPLEPPSPLNPCSGICSGPPAGETNNEESLHGINFSTTMAAGGTVLDGDVLFGAVKAFGSFLTASEGKDISDVFVPAIDEDWFGVRVKDSTSDEYSNPISFYAGGLGGMETTIECTTDPDHQSCGPPYGPDNSDCNSDEFCNDECQCQKLIPCDSDLSNLVCDPDHLRCFLGECEESGEICRIIYGTCSDNRLPCPLSDFFGESPEGCGTCESDCSAGDACSAVNEDYRYYCYNPDQYGPDPDKQACYCYRGISCDGSPATPECNPDNSFCAEGHSCDPDSCTCQPSTSVGNESTYFWDFTSGIQVGSCSNHGGFCDPNSSLCLEDLEICDSVTCECVPLETPQCTVNDSAVCVDADDRLGFGGRVDVPISENLKITGELTVSAWVKTQKIIEEGCDDDERNESGGVVATTHHWRKVEEPPESNNWVHYFHGWTLGDDYGCFNPGVDGSEFTFVVNNGENIQSRAFYRGFFEEYYNIWTHVAGVYKPSESVKLYINGVLVDENSTAISAIDYYYPSDPPEDYIPYPLTFGHRADRPEQGRWTGAIDDVAIYKKALDDKEIELLARRHKATEIASADLVSFWEFNDTLEGENKLKDSVMENNGNGGNNGNHETSFYQSCEGYYPCAGPIHCDSDTEEPFCQPNQGMCPIGYYCDDLTCFCEPADPCDGVTTTYVCDPDDSKCAEDEFCDTAKNCTCQPAEGLSTEATYTWNFVTNTFGPRVVETCNRSALCDPYSYTSPSPFYRSATNALGYTVLNRQDDGEVAIDAVITAMFTQPMSLSSLEEDGSIKIYKCSGIDINGNPTPTDCDVDINGNLTVNNDAYYGRQSVGYFTFTPNGLLGQNTFYLVELDTSIIRGENGVKLIGNDVVSRNYRWILKTRDSDELSTVGCVYLRPFLYWMYELGEMKEYTALPASENNVCVDIRPDTCDGGWYWSSENTDYAKFALPRTSPKFPYNVAIAVSQTVPNSVEMTAECNFQDKKIPGHGDLYIDFIGPHVIDRFPDCGTACLNVKIGATFSRDMVDTSVKDATKLYICYEDSACEPGSMQSVNWSQPPMLDTQEAPNTFTGYVNCYDADSDGNNDYCLLPNTYYRVVINSSAISENEEENLAGLNYFYENCSGCIEDERGYNTYSWVFRTQEDYGLCLPGVIDVKPADTWQDVDKTVNYSARGRTAPDECDPEFGQRLNPYSFGWDWASHAESGWGPEDNNECTGVAIGDPSLPTYSTGYFAADLFGLRQDLETVPWGNLFCSSGKTNPLRDSCGNGVIEFGEDCDDGNIVSGDGCSGTDSANGPCLNEGTSSCTEETVENCCGNEIIETGEECEPLLSDYCGLDCLWTGNTGYVCQSTDNECDQVGSVCSSGDPCILLEVCGNGIIESTEMCDPPGPGCSERCTYTGSVPGKSLCGDGQIGLGEQCDMGELIIGEIPLDDGDGCSADCLVELEFLTTAIVCRSNFNNTFKFKARTGGSNQCSPNCDTGYTCVFLNDISGNDISNGSICGNNIIEAGEECDTGGWCADEPAGNPVLNDYGYPKYCNVFGSYCGDNEICLPYEGTCSLGNSPCKTVGDTCQTQGWCVDGWCMAGGSAYNTDCSHNQECIVGNGADSNGSGICNRDGCSRRCLRNGSVYEDDNLEVGPYQIAQTLADGEAYIQAWIASYEPDKGPLGEGHLKVGNFFPAGKFGIVEKWPNCYWACINAEIGARFNEEAIKETLNTDAIFLYECGYGVDGSNCLIEGKQSISGIEISSYNTLELPSDSTAKNEFRIILPAYYNPIDHDQNPATPVFPTLIPGMYYRVVVRDTVEAVELDNGEAQYMNILNFNDPSYTSEISENDLNSYSWVFRAEDNPDFCSLDRSVVIPQDLTMPEGGNKHGYFAQAWGKPDRCEPDGQRLNPYFFDWRWDDVEMTDISGFINGADILTYDSSSETWGTFASGVVPSLSDFEKLMDGCGNYVIEPGEDCEPPGANGCGADCQHAGTGPCPQPYGENSVCCGNGKIETGEECEDSVNGTFCTATGQPCPTGNCPGGVCLDYCSDICLWEGNTDYAESVCGNGILEAGEDCDTGDEPDDNESDGCTDICTFSGAVPATGSLCGDGLIGLGEECDDKQFINPYCINDKSNCPEGVDVGDDCGNGGGICSNIPKGSDNCSGLDDPLFWCDYADRISCLDNLKHCYWNGIECRVRPCLLESENSNSGNQNWGRPICGNGIVEVGEECDDGGWCQNDQNQWVHCTVNSQYCAVDSPCTPYEAICSVSGLPTNAVIDISCPDPDNLIEHFTGECDGNGYCVINGVKYYQEFCANAGYGAVCDISDLQGRSKVISDGCSQYCIRNSSRMADGLIDPYQVIETVLRLQDFSGNYLSLTDVNEEIYAWSAWDEDATQFPGWLTVQSGLKSEFKIIQQQPVNDSENQCRNVALWAVFSQEVNEESLSSGFDISCTGTNCEISGNLVDSDSLLHQRIRGTCNQNANICHYNVPNDGIGTDIGQCLDDRDCVASKVIVMGSLKTDSGFLNASEDYTFDVNGVKSVIGHCNDDGYKLCRDSSQCKEGIDCNLDACADDSCTWNFSTDDHFCECDLISVKAHYSSGDREMGLNRDTPEDLFTCAGNDCGINTPGNILDDDYDLMCEGGTCANRMEGNQHLYEVMCYDTGNATDKTLLLTDEPTPLSYQGLKFTWSENDLDELIELQDESDSTGTGHPYDLLSSYESIAGANYGDSEVDFYKLAKPNSSNGESEVVINNQYYRTQDSATGQYGTLCAPGSDNCVLAPNSESIQYILITNFICENPWPLTGFYSDPSDPSNPPPTVTNFKMMYCRDFGNAGTEDDLPALDDTNEIIVQDPVEPGTMKEFILPVMSGGEGNSPTDQAIGIRVMDNPLRLSPATWYLSGFCGKRFTIDNICFSDADCGASDPDLVAYYKFDEGQGNEVFDQTGNLDHAGTIHNANWLVPGKFGSTLLFDGSSSKVNIDGPDFEIAKDNSDDQGLTVAAWIYPSKETAGTGRTVISKYKWVSGNEEYGWSLGRLYESDNDFYFVISNGSGRSITGYLDFFTAFVNPDDPGKLNKWSHVVGVYNPSGDIILYIDGSEVSTRSSSLSHISYDPSISLVIGSRSDKNYSYFAGKIDEVKIYKRPLSAEEVRLLYENRPHQCEMNVPSHGSAKSILVDGYQAIQGGRTAYVGASQDDDNDDGERDSSIYLLSYSQNADSRTREIFRRILDKNKQLGFWNFNYDESMGVTGKLFNHRICEDVGYFKDTDILCGVNIPPANIGIGLSSADCRNYDTKSACLSEDNLKHGCRWEEETGLCRGRACYPIYCNNNFDCPNLSCDADKEKIVRDTKRYGDLRDIQINLSNFAGSQKNYPDLSAGSYIENNTFSVWPSWQNTLGSQVGTTLYTDPINEFRGCSDHYCDFNKNGVIDAGDIINPLIDFTKCVFGGVGVDNSCGYKPQLCIPKDPDQEQTCWDEMGTAFSCPEEMRVYAYKSNDDGGYSLYANLEYDGLENWRTSSEDDTNYELPISGCKKLNLDITQSPGPEFVPPVSDCEIGVCYGNTWSKEISELKVCDDNTVCQIKYCDVDGNDIIESSETIICASNSECSPNSCIGGSGYCSGDVDGDGICDWIDGTLAILDNCNPIKSCPENFSSCYNPNQRNTDGDEYGDACDFDCSGDVDNDGVCDEIDNCRTVYNPANEVCFSSDRIMEILEALGLDDDQYDGDNQCDIDHDGIGDACDPCTDLDGDGWWDIDTGVNDENICPRDNCSPAGYVNVMNPGFLVDPSNPLNQNRTGVSSDRQMYCVEANSPLPEICNPSAIPQKNCTVGNCEKLTDDLIKYYNPFQEDYDNDGVGYICDNCIDFDGDGWGDYTFYTHEAITAFPDEGEIADSLDNDQKQHFAGCKSSDLDTLEFEGFSSTPSANKTKPSLKKTTAIRDLDNCPGGPYSNPCYDIYGIQVSCYNPDQNFDLCDPLTNFGDCKIDRGEDCDCCDAATGMSYEEDGSWMMHPATGDSVQCQSHNNEVCDPGGPYKFNCADVCVYCQDGRVEYGGGGCCGDGTQLIGDDPDNPLEECDDEESNIRDYYCENCKLTGCYTCDLTNCSLDFEDLGLIGWNCVIDPSDNPDGEASTNCYERKSCSPYNITCTREDPENPGSDCPPVVKPQECGPECADQYKSLKYGDTISLRPHSHGNWDDDEYKKFMTIDNEVLKAWRPIDGVDINSLTADEAARCYYNFSECPCDAEEFQILPPYPDGSIDYNSRMDEIIELDSITGTIEISLKSLKAGEEWYLTRSYWYGGKVRVNDGSDNCGGECPGTWEKFTLSIWNNDDDNTIDTGDQIILKASDKDKYFDVDWSGSNTNITKIEANDIDNPDIHFTVCRGKMCVFPEGCGDPWECELGDTCACPECQGKSPSGEEDEICCGGDLQVGNCCQNSDCREEGREKCDDGNDNFGDCAVSVCIENICECKSSNLKCSNCGTCQSEEIAGEIKYNCELDNDLCSGRRLGCGICVEQLADENPRFRCEGKTGDDDDCPRCMDCSDIKIPGRYSCEPVVGNTDSIGIRQCIDQEGCKLFANLLAINNYECTCSPGFAVINADETRKFCTPLDKSGLIHHDWSLAQITIVFVVMLAAIIVGLAGISVASISSPLLAALVYGLLTISNSALLQTIFGAINYIFDLISLPEPWATIISFALDKLQIWISVQRGGEIIGGEGMLPFIGDLACNLANILLENVELWGILAEILGVCGSGVGIIPK